MRERECDKKSEGSAHHFSPDLPEPKASSAASIRGGESLHGSGCVDVPLTPRLPHPIPLEHKLSQRYPPPNLSYSYHKKLS